MKTHIQLSVTEFGIGRKMSGNNKQIHFDRSTAILIVSLIITGKERSTTE